MYQQKVMESRTINWCINHGVKLMDLAMRHDFGYQALKMANALRDSCNEVCQGNYEAR
jgi:hypothetical protein